ncbi:T9SS type A sorting domain-containing protein [Flavobacterium sp. MC2016-06]|uniref:T9SS type A sorting domain-containing protein n=1 Tax=Flavobacterium sp. MC2016-06 TaxID=2676308 RepID=UPI0031DB8BD2
MKKKLLLLMMLFCTLLVHQNANSQTTLAAGDLAFIGYNTSPLDGFSFITLKDMSAGTIVYFTEQGWNGNTVGPTWVSGSTETHLQWTVPAFTAAGTIVSVMETTADAFTVTGTSGIGLAAGFTGFNLSAGDQILAYQSTVGAKPVLPNLPTFIAGVNGDYNSADYDATTTWNLPGTSGGPSSALPLGLTNGVNCISLFPAPGPEIANSKLMSSVTLAGTAAQILATINNPANWDHNATANYTITPVSYPTPAVITTVAPTVTTTAATSIGAVKAVIGGNVTSDGGDTTAERGIVWATTTNPTTSNNKFQIGTGSGTFTGTVSTFPAATLIYYKAYVKNSVGTAYGTEMTFTTGAALDTSATPQSNVSCNGGNNGVAAVTVTGGKTPYTYSWAPSGGTGAIATSLAQGTYTITITDGESSQITRTFNITQPTAINLSTGGSTTSVSCFNGSNGTATVSPTGGTAPYTYSWAPSGGTGATASGLAAGTYTVTVTDNNTCQATRTFVVTQPTALDASVGTSNPVSCFNGANGTATVSPTGGTAPYTYSWSPSGGTGATASGLAAGTYTVTVTDNNTCQATKTFTITQPLAALDASSGSSTSVSCFNGSNGTATVNATGGTGPYTYSWSPSGGTGATASGLTAGTYTVTVTDNNTCQATKTFTITQPASALTASAVSQTNVSCNTGSNGSATVSATGGTPGYTYSWAPSGGTAATASGLTAGTYIVTITDANSCTATQTFTITQPITALLITPSQTNVSCNFGSNGSATATVTGGTPGYTYSWSPSGGNAATASGLTAGTYTVTVTDANSCNATQTFTITEPNALIASAVSQTNVSCNTGTNGTATVSATGGTPGYTYSWSPSGGTAATATGLAAGTYTVTVTDANSCTATQSFTITQPASAVIASAVSQTNVSCNTGSNGSATVSATGGTPGYTYSWSPSGGNAATASGLSAGTYIATVTDANGCTGTQTFTITQPNALVASAVSQTNVSCNTGSNGSATVSATGGIGAYTYSWSPSGGTAATASGLTAGTYTVTVTDANFCTATQNFTITQPIVLTITPSQTNVSCNFGSNGTATAAVTGGVPGYTYSWAPSGGTAATASGLSAGTYTVTVTDANSCTATQSFTITQPNALVASIGAQTNVSCNTGSNGSATVTTTGGTGAYTYSWAPTGGTAASATGLTAGTYTVTVTDANSCTTTQTFTITEPNILIASASAQSNVSCRGGSNGSATVNAAGGTGTYTYSWAPAGGTAATATGLTAGTYTATVTDANGCNASQSFTITQPAAVLSALAGQINATCGPTGQANVTVSGGTSPYTYLWSPSGGTAATATGLTAGNYSVLITDDNGCTLTQNFTITQVTNITATASSTNVSCNGGANGTASVTNVLGGNAPYSYSWSPSGGTAATATGLTAGSYTVTITDNNSCSTTKTFTITQPSVLAASAGSQTNVSCNSGSNGSATVSVTGGAGAYTYSWAPSGGTAATASGLTAGTYTVTVTDANLCSTTQSFTITQPNAFVASVGSQTNVSCNTGSNGSATVTATGGTGAYTYSWAPTGGTAASATGLTAGTYTVTVTDANGCTATQSFTITEPTFLVATAGSQTNVSCNGGTNGSATVSVTGGTTAYTYSWAPSGGTAATATGLTAGTYTVTVTDANFCTATQSFTITEPNILVATAGSQTNVSCNSGSNGSATVSVTGGTAAYTYSWAPAGGTAATATGLTAGTYTVTVTDANGCTATQSFTITQPAPLITSIGLQTNVSCNGGSNGTTTVSVTGGTGAYTYSWAPAGGTTATATGLTAGTYTVTVTDANFCTATQSFTITEPNILVASAGSQTNVSCNSGSNGSATVSVTGGTPSYTYFWAPAGGTAATATGLTAGTYTVTVTDANFCTATQSFTITQPVALAATAGTKTNVFCNGGSNGTATVNVTGGTGAYTYSWVPAGGTAATATGLTAGIYTVTVKDANLCTATQSFTITQPAPLVATAGTKTNVSCNSGSNGSATVNVTGGTGAYTYSWAPAGGTAATATGLTAGTYTVTVTDANLCTATQSFTITQPAPLVATAGTKTNVSCNSGSNGSATVNVTGGTGAYTYSWAPAGGTAATATGLTAGTYTVTVTDANLCTATQSFTITQPIILAATVTQTNVTCIGGTDGSAGVTVTGGTGTYSYIWSPSGGTAASASGLTAGNYSVTITDANGCTLTKSIVISTIPDVTAPVPNVATLPSINNYCSILASNIPIPTATDNCVGIINATTTDPLNYTSEGTYVITWTYNDGHGNTATQNQTLNVTASPLGLVTFNDVEYTYNGSLRTNQVQNLPLGASVAYAITPAGSTANGAINAGIYNITATVSPSASMPNCSPIVLTAKLTIKKAAQLITFGALPIKSLGGTNSFNLDATSSSSLAIRYTYTYASALPAATVSNTGVVTLLKPGTITITAHQDGDTNYLPAVDVSQILIIKNDNAVIPQITIGTTVYSNPPKDINYLMSCGEGNLNVSILNNMNATITPSTNFIIDAPKPGIYKQNIKVTSEDGSTVNNYSITVEKPFGFFDIVRQKFNNVLLVNNNPQTNGGYEFVSYQWFKNGQLVGTGQYYSAGNSVNDQLDPTADYSVKMTTKDGKVLQTCTSKIAIQNTLKAQLYPNPVAIGKTVTVETDFPQEELENMQISLYSVSGQLIKTVPSSKVKTEIQLPEATQGNVYLVVIETANIKKTLKVIVK